MVHGVSGSPTDDALRGGGKAWWAAAVMTAINALTSAGFSIAGLVSVVPQGNETARVYAMYAAARSLPLAAVVLALVFARSTRALAALAIVMGIVQACDALIGVAQHDLSKTLGPAVFAVLTLAGVRALVRGGPPRSLAGRA
jgi:hypothetical protein